jgi:hypothetical protein
MGKVGLVYREHRTKRSKDKRSCMYPLGDRGTEIA